jgi:hypothetical protein
VWNDIGIMCRGSYDPSLPQPVVCRRIPSLQCRRQRISPGSQKFTVSIYAFLRVVNLPMCIKVIPSCDPFPCIFARDYRGQLLRQCAHFLFQYFGREDFEYYMLRITAETGQKLQELVGHVESSQKSMDT